MKYLVIELQTNDGVTANIVTQYDTLPAAESAYYMILAAAVISTVDIHAVVLMDSTGFIVKNDCYQHPKEG